MADNDREREKLGDILGISDTTPSETDDFAGQRPLHNQAEDERSTAVNDEDVEQRRLGALDRAVGDPARHDNPRTGKISDW